MDAIVTVLAVGLSHATFMHWSLIAITVFIVLILAWCQLLPDEFDLRNLVAGPDGKIDKFAVAFMVGALFLTWVFVHYAIREKLDLLWFVAYALLMMFPKIIEQVAGPILIRRYGIPVPVPPSPSLPGAAPGATP